MNRNCLLGFGSAWALVLSGMLGSGVRAEDAGPTKEKSEVKPASLERAEKKVELPAPPREVLDSLLKLHNEVRVRRGLRPFKHHPKLTAAAQRYADYSHRTGQFGHYADGRSPSERISAEGLAYGSWAENMAWGPQSSDDAMNTWLNSGGHHANILSGHTHVGFGKVGSVWVTVFANPEERDEAS